MDLLQELSQLRAEFDTLSSQSQELDSRTDKTLRNLQKIADESNRVADVAHNAPFRTTGHNPIMGWIFGPVNILSDTLTESDIITSCNVRNMAITEQIPTTAAFSKYSPTK